MAVNRYPLASLIVTFYKQEQFVKETVAGALAQTYPNLEIILSDDNSSDGTFEEIKKAVKNYQGPHKIILNRNDNNMGLVPHVNKTLFELSHGDYIFLNGGDDISMPMRVENGIRGFSKFPKVAAVTFSRIIINKDGLEIGEKRVVTEHVEIIDNDYLRKDNFMAGASALSFRKTLLDFYGKLNDDCQTEDSVLRFRALLSGGILCMEEFGLKYRVHDNNISRSLGNFKTDLIAMQYERDLEKQRMGLSSELYVALIKKIEFYSKYRNCQVLCEQERSRVKRIIRRIQMHTLKSKYLRTVSKVSIV